MSLYVPMTVAATAAALALRQVPPWHGPLVQQIVAYEAFVGYELVPDFLPRLNGVLKPLAVTPMQVSRLGLEVIEEEPRHRLRCTGYISGGHFDVLFGPHEQPFIPARPS